MTIFQRRGVVASWLVPSLWIERSWGPFLEAPGNRPLSRGDHFESQGNKKLCFCPSSLALNERLDGQNLLFQHCVIKVYYRTR